LWLGIEAGGGGRSGVGDDAGGTAGGDKA